MAWWDLTVNNFEKTEVPFDIYSSGTFPNYLIVIDGFCIYKTTNTDGIYVNDYKTDIDYTNVLNIFYFKNKIYIIYDKLADYLYGAIYSFQPTEPYLIKEKDLYKQVEGHYITETTQCGQDTFIFGSKIDSYLNKCTVFYIENEEIKTMSFPVGSSVAEADPLIYISEKFLKNPDLTEPGIYYLIESRYELHIGIVNDIGQFEESTIREHYLTWAGYAYAKEDSLFYVGFNLSTEGMRIECNSFHRTNGDCKINSHTIAEYSGIYWDTPPIYCEDTTDKQNFNVYIYSDWGSELEHAIFKINFEPVKILPIEFNIDTNGLKFQQLGYSSGYLGLQTTPPFETLFPITEATLWNQSEGETSIYEISFDNDDRFIALSKLAKLTGIQINDIPLIDNEAVPINISSGTHTIKLIGEAITPHMLSLNLIDENNKFTLHELDMNTQAIGKENPNVFKDIIATSINLGAVMKQDDYYMVAFAPSNPLSETDVYYGAIKYNNPNVKISSITIDGREYPYQEPDGIMVEGLSINKTTNIYLHTPSCKPVAIINPDGQKTYARVWSTNLPTKK